MNNAEMDNNGIDKEQQPLFVKVFRLNNFSFDW
jgi:hypothetical protein